MSAYLQSLQPVTFSLPVTWISIYHLRWGSGSIHAWCPTGVQCNSSFRWIIRFIIGLPTILNAQEPSVLQTNTSRDRNLRHGAHALDPHWKCLNRTSQSILIGWDETDMKINLVRWRKYMEGRWENQKLRYLQKYMEEQNHVRVLTLLSVHATSLNIYAWWVIG